ncbi:MAG: SDR family oxidoreductase [Bdellovibrionales bacterium]
MTLNNPLALITGASSGIGLELANIYAKNSYNLILVARSKSKIESIAAQLKKNFPIEVYTFDVDLSEKGAAQKLHTFCRTSILKPNVLINNAGFGEVGEFLKARTEIIEEMTNLNMTNLTLLCRLFGADMLSQNLSGPDIYLPKNLPKSLPNKKNEIFHNHIVNIASTAAFLPGPYMAVYYATKAYVLSFTEALSEELKSCAAQISVTAICPGPTWSGFQERAQLNTSMMVKSPWIMTSEQVALAAYNAIQGRRRVYITGWMNWLLTIISHWTPRRINTIIAASINKKRNKESL